MDKGKLGNQGPFGPPFGNQAKMEEQLEQAAMEQEEERQIHEVFQGGIPGKFIIHPERRFKGQWNHRGEAKKMDRILELFSSARVGEETLLKRFEDSVFAHFIQAHRKRPKFQGVLFRYLGFRMTYPDRADELHFRFNSDTPKTCVFGSKEFAVVSGLRFGNMDRNFGDSTMVFGQNCWLAKKSNSAICLADVKKAMEYHAGREGVQNAEVLYRLGLVYFVYGYLLGWADSQGIPFEILYIVEDLNFAEQFAWGEYLWRITYDKMAHLMATVKSMSVKHPPQCGHKPNVEGWASAFVYWAYDLFPRLRSCEPVFVTAKTCFNALPRMLRWECHDSTPRGNLGKQVAPEVGMRACLEFLGEEVAYLIGLGIPENDVRAPAREFPSPPLQGDPEPMEEEIVGPSKQNQKKKRKFSKDVSFATERAGGSEEGREFEEEEGREEEEEEEERREEGHEEEEGRGTSVKLDRLLEAVNKIGEVTNKLVSDVGELREKMDSQGRMIIYLYHKLHSQQVGGRDMQGVDALGSGGGSDLGGDLGSERGVSGHGRGVGHGVGGLGGDVGHASTPAHPTRSSDVARGLNTSGLQVNMMYTEQMTPQSGTGQGTPQGGYMWNSDMGRGFSNQGQAIHEAGHIFDDNMDYRGIFSDRTPPTLSTGPASFDTGGGSANVELPSSLKMKVRGPPQIPTKYNDFVLDKPRNAEKTWTKHDKVSAEIRNKFHEWYDPQIPNPARVRICKGRPHGESVEEVVDKEYFERLLGSRSEIDSEVHGRGAVLSVCSTNAGQDTV